MLSLLKIMLSQWNQVYCHHLTDSSSPHQPMKLGEHLNSLLLNMCDDITLSRMSLRTVLDICSKHIRNSTCDPPFSYVRKLVRLVLGSLSQVLCPGTNLCKTHFA